jgi:Flp pilus assembly protein TadD
MAGDYDHAILDFSKLIEIRTDDEDAYRGRGEAYASKHEDDAARADLSKAIEIAKHKTEVGDDPLP